MTEKVLKDSIREEKIRQCLRNWFIKKGKMVLIREKALREMKYSEGRSTPDIVAYKRRANTVYLVECKKASKLRHVGHAFGQMLADKLSLTRMRRKDLQKKLQQLTGKSDLNTLKLSFGVAFPKQHVDRKEIGRMITMMRREEPFKNLAIYVVDTVNTNVSNSVIKKSKGKLVNYTELMKS